MGKGKDPRNFPVKKTLSLINFYFLFCVNDSKRLQYTSYTAPLSF